MAYVEFWSNVRGAARFVSPKSPRDSLKIEPKEIETILRQTPDWLSVKTVAGFDIQDFDFLPEEQRQKLAQHVTEFRAIASQIGFRVKPTTDQLEKALPSLCGMVELFEYYRYGDALAFKYGKQIETLIKDIRPAGLAELRFWTGADYVGDQVIWIMGLLEDTDHKAMLDLALDVHPILKDAARTIAPELLSDVTIRAVSEQIEIGEMTYA